MTGQPWRLGVAGSSAMRDPDRIRQAARSGIAQLLGRYGHRPLVTVHTDRVPTERVIAARLVSSGWRVRVHDPATGELVDQVDALFVVRHRSLDDTGPLVAVAEDRGLVVVCRYTTNQRGHRHRPPRRRRARTRDGRSDAPQADTLPHLMACLPALSVAVTGPLNAVRAGAQRAGFGDAPSPGMSAWPVTGRSGRRGFDHPEEGASVWTLSPCQGAPRSRHTTTSHTATARLATPTLVPVVR